MSAYLASNDVLNALSTYLHEKNSRGNLKSSYQMCVYESIKTNHKHLNENEAYKLANSLVNLDISLTKERNEAYCIAELVFDQLLKENVNSLKALYPTHSDMWQNDYKFKPSQQVITWVLSRDIKGLASLASMAKGLIYQSCEHKEFRSSVAYFLLSDIKNSLLSDLVNYSLSKDSDQQPWASWLEPRSDIKTICLT